MKLIKKIPKLFSLYYMTDCVIFRITFASYHSNILSDLSVSFILHAVCSICIIVLFAQMNKLLFIRCKLQISPYLFKILFEHFKISPLLIKTYGLCTFSHHGVIDHCRKFEWYITRVNIHIFEYSSDIWVWYVTLFFIKHKY